MSPQSHKAATTATICFGSGTMGMCDKVFHMKRDAEPDKMIHEIQIFAKDSINFEEFIGRLLIACGGEEPPIDFGAIKKPTYCYCVDYDLNAVRVVLDYEIEQKYAKRYVKKEKHRYGGLGNIDYVKDERDVYLIAELQPGKEAPIKKELSESR